MITQIEHVLYIRRCRLLLILTIFFNYISEHYVPLTYTRSFGHRRFLLLLSAFSFFVHSLAEILTTYKTDFFSFRVLTFKEAFSFIQHILIYFLRHWIVDMKFYFFYFLCPTNFFLFAGVSNQNNVNHIFSCEKYKDVFFIFYYQF